MNEVREKAVARLMELPTVISNAEERTAGSTWSLAAARDALTDAESAARISGECDGPNAEARAAQVRAKTISEREALRTAEHRHALNQAHLSALQSELVALHAVADLLRCAP